MFVLWIGCALQLLTLVKICYSTGDLEPQYRLKISMQQVGALLADIDKKIVNERNLLSALASNPTLKSQNITQWFAGMSERVDKKNNEDHSSTIQQANLKFRHHLSGMNMDEEPEMMTLKHDSTTLKPSELYVIKDVSELVNEWSSDKDTSVYVAPVQARKTIPLKSKMQVLMTEQDIGYCYAAIVGIIDVLVDKDSNDLKKLVDAFGKAIARMSKRGKLNSLGNLFANRVKLLRIWTSLSSVVAVQDNAHKAQLALWKEDQLSDDAVKILTEYDEFFTKDEGEVLLNKVTELYSYNATHGDLPAIQSLMESLIEALVAPANRKRNSFELKRLIAMINKAYLKRFPDFRRSDIDAVLDTLDEYDIKKSYIRHKQRRMGHGTVKSGFKKLLRHLITKHPKLLREFIQHFKRHKHHHNKNKKHHKYHHKKQHHYSKHKHDDDDEEESSDKQETTVITQNTTTAQDGPKFRESHSKAIQDQSTTQIKISASKAASVVKKRYNVVPVIRSGHKRIKPSRLTRRLLRDTNDTQSINKYGTRFYTDHNDYHQMVQKSMSTTKLHHRHKLRHNNTILRKIVEESSYSDEETYLKAMLDDAFMHWNDTKSNNSSDILKKGTNNL